MELEWVRHISDMRSIVHQINPASAIMYDALIIVLPGGLALRHKAGGEATKQLPFARPIIRHRPTSRIT